MANEQLKAKHKDLWVEFVARNPDKLRQIIFTDSSERATALTMDDAKALASTFNDIEFVQIEAKVTETDVTSSILSQLASGDEEQATDDVPVEDATEADANGDDSK